MHHISPSMPAVDDVHGPRLVLRDGSVAGVRPAVRGDADAMRRFFHELSPDSRRRRFFTGGDPPAASVQRLCDSSDQERGRTLVVERSASGPEVAGARLIAVGSYLALTADVAEVAFAVADDFQGKGLGTALLERLAVLAAADGFQRFQATTLADNQSVLDVLRDSGFEIRSKSSGGCLDVQLSLTPSFEGVASAEERARSAAAASLRPLLAPQGVAVIGASRDGSSIGRAVLNALLCAGFRGPVYPVNRSATTVESLKAYASARELPSGVDLGIVAVPRDAVLEAVDDCAASGIKALVVITAGFAEDGDEGRELQRQLVERVRGYGMRLVGPNCMGLMNTDPAVRLNASFSTIFPAEGHVSFSSQSGALGIAILALGAQRGLGLSSFVSIGNKADVSGNDLLQYWENDERTTVILLYLESFGNPRRFARLARRISRKKPIVAVKAGRTTSGLRAAGSHTAALAARDTAVDALFRQSGVIRANTIDEMFDIAACLETQPLPNGSRIAIVTNAGGPGILAVDACEAAGLTIAELSAETRSRLTAFVSSMASVGNPVDLVATAGGDQYRRAIETLLAAPEVDALLVIFTPLDIPQSATVMAAVSDGIAAGRNAGAVAKPVLACVMADAGPPAPLILENERIPAYAFPENAARALGRIAIYASWRRQAPGLFWGFDDVRAGEARAICREAGAERGETWLTDDETRRLLNAFGLPVAAGAVAHTADEAVALAATFGLPVAAKVVSRAVPHKTEIGGVRLGLSSGHAVRKAFMEILASARRVVAPEAVEGVLVQPMITGVETMMGIVDDPVFGPLIAFGLGGVHVEILGDVRFRIAPLTDRDVDELLHEPRGFPLLQGYRGHTPADIEALREILLRVSRLAELVPEILELDLNPVIALQPGRGCRIVDARVRVGHGRDARVATAPPVQSRPEPVVAT